MAWIESHQELREHPKTKKAARLLGVPVPHMIGLLHCLWWWTYDYAPDGDLSPYDEAEIADAAGWDADPGKFVAALVDCGRVKGRGFVDREDDGRLLVHDWDQYGLKQMNRKREQAERMKATREAYRSGIISQVKQRDGDNCRYCGIKVRWSDRRGPDGATYDHVDPSKGDTFENLVVCCRSCNSTKGRRTPAEANLVLQQIGSRSEPRFASNGEQKSISDLTRQDQTLPDLTRPDQDLPRAHARENQDDVVPVGAEQPPKYGHPLPTEDEQVELMQAYRDAVPKRRQLVFHVDVLRLLVRRHGFRAVMDALCGSAASIRTAEQPMQYLTGVLKWAGQPRRVDPDADPPPQQSGAPPPPAGEKSREERLAEGRRLLEQQRIARESAARAWREAGQTPPEELSERHADSTEAAQPG